MDKQHGSPTTEVTMQAMNTQKKKIHIETWDSHELI